MPERLVPISKKQHDLINNTMARMREEQHALQVAANIILLSVDEDLGAVEVTGAVCREGVYALAVLVPDPPKDA